MRTVTIAGVLVLSLTILSCDNHIVKCYDDPPPAPTGLNSVTGDGEVHLSWYAVGEDDIDSYIVYRSTTSPNSGFRYLAEVSWRVNYYIDRAVTNGRTYYYRVSAVDLSGQESELSDYVMDTPRPEGFGVVIWDYRAGAAYCTGFDLYAGRCVPYDDVDCDIFIDYDAQLGACFINVRHSDYYIQDYGYAYEFDDVGYAPDRGWSSFGYIEAIPGHIYVLKLRHFGEWHYAKIRVEAIFDTSPVSMRFSWAYQIDPGNRELKVGLSAVKHPSQHVASQQ